jgi:hypothetical protein
VQEPVHGEEIAYKRSAIYAASHKREGKEKGNEVTWVTPPLKEVIKEGEESGLMIGVTSGRGGGGPKDRKQ